MVKARLIVSVLSAIAMFSVVTPPAHAGGGMGQGAGLTTCRLILNGAPNQGQTVSLVDFGTGGDQVKVGAAVLLCDVPATGTRDAGPAIGPAIGEPNSVTCYSVSGADRARIGATMQDPFGTQPVQIGAIQLLCVPSFFDSIQF